MDDLNKTELKGKIIRVDLKTVGDSLVGNFTVLTNYLFSIGGEAKIEETYHNVTAWRSKSISCLSSLQKGQFVRVTGRYHEKRWTDKVTGEEKKRWELVADTVRIIK